MKQQFRIISIDAWCDGQSCVECGSTRLTDSEECQLVKCLDCSHEFNSKEGKQWTWNDWRYVSTFYESEYGNLTEESAKHCFADKLSGTVKQLEEKFEIDDDGYNLVLIDKTDKMPVYAIEYGNED